MKLLFRYTLTLFCILSHSLNAQTPINKDSSTVETGNRPSKLVLPKINGVEIVQMLQAWNVFTLQNAGISENERLNDVFIRRGRIGVRGNIRKDLSYNVIFAYDGIGRNANTAGNGSSNADDNRDFYLWDAFVTWNAQPMLNVTLGYFRPQVGREHISAPFTMFSFEKSLPNFQPRTHLVGRSTGRETGVNLGGLHKGEGWSFNYNVGFFDLTHESIIGDGSIWSPMLTARMAFTLGDPEMDTYKVGYVQSYYGQRKGVTFALNATHQGETQLFRQNSFYGADVLANYGHWDFVAEYDWLSRDSYLGDTGNTNSTLDKVYSLKAGYNFLLKNGKIIQLSGTYSGQLADGTHAAPFLNSFTRATEQEVFDTGINYLIDKDKLKLNLHYVWGRRENMPNDPKYSYVGAGFQYVL